MFGNRQFCEDYFSLLIANTGSVLYHELQNNQDRTFGHAYEIPESNRLLHFLFTDAQIANNLEVWRPVGNHILKLLSQDKSPESISHINGSAGYFEYECWGNQVYVGVMFFDLMVTSAAHQGVTWHMWLYYMAHMTKQLELIYDSSDPSVNKMDEFPTRSAHLVYDIVYVLCDWVNLITRLPENSPHVKPPDIDRDEIREWKVSVYPNNHIPASAAIALGTSLYTIVMSNRFERHFVTEMYAVVLRTVKDLTSDGHEGYLRFFLINSLIRGGQNRFCNEYGERLYSFLTEIDPFILFDIKDYQCRLQEVYPESEEYD